jgi:CRP-like cAMP-binding protein
MTIKASARQAILQGLKRTSWFAALGDDGLEQICSAGQVWRFEAGETLLRQGEPGEIALLDGGERTASVIAIEAGEAFRLSRRNLVPILLENPEALMALILMLCRKLRLATRMHEASVQAMDARLASGLLRLAELHSSVLQRGVRIDLDLTQTELGNYVQMSRSNVSRQLGQLKAAGIIDIDGTEIVIRDLARLASASLGTNDG